MVDMRSMDICSIDYYNYYSHCGHIFTGKTVRCVGDEHAGLADRSVANDHAFDGTSGRHGVALACLLNLLARIGG